MRRALLILVFLAALGLNVSRARIGETFDQCKQRYGKVTAIPTPYAFGSETKELAYYRYQKNGIIIQVGILKGKAADLTFSHAPPGGDLTDVEIDMLLNADSAGMQWKMIQDGKLTFFTDGTTPTSRYGPYRQRDDGVIATIDGPYLHIFTPEWMAFIDEKMKSHSELTIEAIKKNLEGF